MAALLLDLSRLAEGAGGGGGGGSGSGADGGGGGASAPGPARQWLAAALAALPPGALAPGEGAAAVAAWGPLLGAHGARSYVALRRLRRALREFAEQHARG